MLVVWIAHTPAEVQDLQSQKDRDILTARQNGRSVKQLLFIHGNTKYAPCSPLFVRSRSYCSRLLGTLLFQHGEESGFTVLYSLKTNCWMVSLETGVTQEHARSVFYTVSRRAERKRTVTVAYQFYKNEVISHSVTLTTRRFKRVHRLIFFLLNRTKDIIRQFWTPCVTTWERCWTATGS